MATRFQLDVPDQTRRAVKVEAARAGLLVSQLATVALDYVTSLLASGQVPKELLSAIESAKKKSTEEKAAEGDSGTRKNPGRK